MAAISRRNRGTHGTTVFHGIVLNVRLLFLSFFSFLLLGASILEAFQDPENLLGGGD